jgi:DNA-binding Lrp family transcriptional regulator
MTVISETDKAILNLIQLDFPIDARPFRVLAEKLDLSEEELIARIQAMKGLQVIRRIGGNFSPDRLGYYSTLCTAKVPEKKIDLFTRTVNMYAGVTHNYMRDHEFNIWFTFIAPSRDQIAESLEEISRQTGVSPILNLPAPRVFKISANFKL